MLLEKYAVSYKRQSCLMTCIPTFENRKVTCFTPYTIINFKHQITMGIRTTASALLSAQSIDDGCIETPNQSDIFFT